MAIYTFEAQLVLPNYDSTMRQFQEATHVAASEQPYLDLIARIARSSGRTRRFGEVVLADMQPDQFAGSLFISDDPDETDKLDVVLFEAGIPRNVEYHSLNADTLLLGGDRIRDNLFAVTAVFRAINGKEDKRATKRFDALLTQPWYARRFSADAVKKVANVARKPAK